MRTIWVISKRVLIMYTTLEQKMSELDPGRHTRIEDNAALILAEMSLEELRRAHKQSHASMAKRSQG
jgi:ABC-type Zn uptake system ZnuABC Zn-binding protein ZnuA